ncbi:MAG: MBL fold metallo-hydrolase [Candidatus Thiodiazotropha sp.]
MANKLNFDVEFLPVGEGSAAGDAIVISYGGDRPEEVMIVDGGTKDSGEKMVEHINECFGLNTIISHIVCSHPDSDHSSGLRVILDNFQVNNLWVHALWYHAEDIIHLFNDKRWTTEGLSKAIKSEYSIIDELISTAYSKGINVYEPFQGSQIGPFTVLSPTKYVYQHLLAQFRKTPDPDVNYLQSVNMWLEPRKGLFASLLEKAIQLVPETWEFETLRDGGVTAAENETSTVLFGDFGDSAVLLTADAGINALSWSYDFANETSLDFNKLSLIQVPHHGSRNNVSPRILDAILGPKQARGMESEKMKAIVSAPKDDEKHPRKVVMNAFRRRGAPVRTTQGSKYRFHSGFPARDGYNVAKPLEFFNEVEDYD